MDKYNILTSVKKLLEEYQELTPILSKYLTDQKISAEDRNFLLSDLSILLLNDDYTMEIAALCSPVLLDLLSRAGEMNKDASVIKHEWICICVSKLIWNFHDVDRFAMQYFERSFSFFCRFEDCGEPPAKRAKSEMIVPPAFKLIKAAYLLLLYDTATFKELCDWSVLMQFITKGDVKSKWFAYECLILIGNMRSNEMLFSNFSDEEIAQCIVEEMECNRFWNYEEYRPFKLQAVTELQKFKFAQHDFSKGVVNVEGVLLSRRRDSYSRSKENPSSENFVIVPSVKKSLYRLALAVSANEPILLQGPVGCGKTSLVEYLARVTGHKPFNGLLRVQLGDHIDSKMLLGTHCCTDIPGEFVWKAGILIQAMTEGHWLLLEDIDCAPMDVLSLLVPVFQSRTLCLPGHGTPIKAVSGFQLFATQRLVSGYDGSYLRCRNNAQMIEKQWRRITIHPFSRNELKQVISTRWPKLEKLLDRILEIYSLFSSDLSSQNENGSVNEPLNFYNNHGRLIATRDLFKFCGRIVENLDAKKEASINMFLHALECFCDNIPNLETKIQAAENIGTKFNILKTKAEYYYTNHKPSIQTSNEKVVIGRVNLYRRPAALTLDRSYSSFALTRQASSLLEKVAVAIVRKEPVLLVGETGTGKTSVVQQLANMTNHKLTVINMSQQSDSVDLIGGYKPVDLSFAVLPIKEKFTNLFPHSVSFSKNVKFLQHVNNCFYKKKFAELVELMLFATDSIVPKLQETNGTPEGLDIIAEWIRMGEKLKKLKEQIQLSKNLLAFRFIEGALVKAMKNGEWILLDEINLAEAETLECLAGVLEKDGDGLLLPEEDGSSETVTRHPDFHLFACMNPATDIGKRDLPVGIRNRFTEFFVEELNDKNDLSILVQEYLKGLALNSRIMEDIVEFYFYIKKAAASNLSDGAGHHPHYSLRTLCRALQYASTNPCHNIPRSLYEAFCLSFLSQLDHASHPFVTDAICKKILGKTSNSVLKQVIPEPPSNIKYTPIQGYWIRSGKLETAAPENYIFTNTVQRNLHDLARIVSCGKYPVLLQGETSVGKTSLVQWLAKATGNVCLRVNNHEHTDIQEYVGTYSAEEDGKLVFKEGILVEAMRNGYWIILDELNLAPTEVMEALNRVLDDNRELFITETHTLVKAHPGFMIFATQNPPGLYGGRKLLSRAFRNRFIELHFNEIPPPELENILHKRSQIPLSYSKRLVGVMHDLQIRRRESGVFAGKHSFITLRDLFRWGDRYVKTGDKPVGFDWLQLLADEGYLLLAGRVRLVEETEVIREVIQKRLGRKVNPNDLFSLSETTSAATKDILSDVMKYSLSGKFENVAWTYSMRRLAVLVGKAIQFKEPVLMVGTTGSGKTTMCQIFAELYDRKLYSVNCHMHSEGADFLGGLRPVRDPAKRKSKLFEWVDGPLIEAMQEGAFFLADEISLADDSVLERLNSVLETEQKLFLAEKCFDTCEESEITAKSGFHFLSTMNPGGDYGKKELSPALRNRFTEIWCPSSISILSDIVTIVEHNVKNLKMDKYAEDELSGFGKAISEFVNYFLDLEVGRRTTLSTRDILTWVEFINLSQTFTNKMTPSEAYLHGAFLAFLDSIGSGLTALGNEEYMLNTKKQIFQFLVWQIEDTVVQGIEFIIPELYDKELIGCSAHLNESHTHFGIGPFVIECGQHVDPDWAGQYVLESKTPKANVLRLLRAMQLPKPILLEGSPGVGKTSLISILAQVTGHKITRINLSEQTDISDLFGADLPIDDGEKGEFAWRDGPLLQALKRGDWILLDELNLASQSVLEGLNACLDHRNEIYIPELGMTFKLDKYVSRIFGCQNPQRQGGSRKGLPQSFLNRFTQVYMRSMEKDDMEYIAASMHPTLPPELVSVMVKYNHEMSTQINTKKMWGHSGSPWEFNLRDIFRWCQIMIMNQNKNEFNLGEYVKLIYIDRLRTSEDKKHACNLFNSIIKTYFDDGQHLIVNRNLTLNVYEKCVQLGYALLPRAKSIGCSKKMLCVPPSQLCYLESLMKCIENNWMPILVGPSGSGKTTLVQNLANLCGQKLYIMSVNSDMDTIELLGGFEQADVFRKIEFIIEALQPVIENSIMKCLRESEDSSMHTHLKYTLARLYPLGSSVYSSPFLQKDNNAVKKLTILRDLLEVLEYNTEWAYKRVVARSERAVNKLLKRLNGRSSYFGGKFEWVDSILIKAAQKGYWLLIDDANFCSASVLDRLNALLEPNGVLTVNEQGVMNGELRTVLPHPDFRIILAMNPKHGEISRAMRNRGIEIYIEPVTTSLILQRDIFNSSILAQCKGLIHNKLLIHFCSLHQKLCLNPEIESPCLSDFINAVSLCVQMGQNHGNACLAFHESCLTVYAENSLNVVSRKIITDIIEKEVQLLQDLQPDYNIPISNFLPTSLDYKQCVILSSAKKYASIFAVFFKEFVGNAVNKPPFPEDSEGRMSLFVSPPPRGLANLPTVTAQIKKFVIALKLLYESCPLSMHKYLCVWLRHNIQKFIRAAKRNWDDTWKQIVQSMTRYQEMILKLENDPVITLLKNCVTFILNAADFNIVNQKELPLDPRWNMYLYQKLMLRLKQKHEDAETIEFQLMSHANRFNLLILFKSLHFLNNYLSDITVSKSKKSLSTLAREMEDNPESQRDSTLYVLAYFPRLFKTLAKAIIELLVEESGPCDEEFYWKLYNAIYSYYLCHRIFSSPYERGPHHQFKVLSILYLWLMKKMGYMYNGILRMSPLLLEYAEAVNASLPCNKAIVKFRHKCLKYLGQPFTFSDERAAELSKIISEVYAHLDIVERLKSPKTRVKDLKVIWTNLEVWMTSLADATLLCTFEKNNKLGMEVVNGVKDVRTQMCDADLITSDNDDDDEIMELCMNPAKQPTITDSELTSTIQILPLWDYIFITYEAEMLSNAAQQIEQNFQNHEFTCQTSMIDMFVAWGVRIGCSPIHMSHLVALQQYPSKQTMAPNILYFLQHARHGFSSDGLRSLTYKTSENSCSQNTITEKWNTNYFWAKQHPLLVHICSSLFDRPFDSPLVCHFPLDSYSEKIDQLKQVKQLLWKHFELLANPKTSFRTYTSALILHWFNNLIASIASLANISLADIDEKTIMNFFEKQIISSLVTVAGDTNILCHATESVIHMQESIVCEDDTPHLQWLMGVACTYVGLLTCQLLQPRDTIDPALKAQIKVSTLRELYNHLVSEKEMQKWMSSVTSGQSFYPEWIPDHHAVRTLEQMCIDTELKLPHKERKVPCRPADENVFIALIDDVKHYSETVGSSKNIIDIINKLHTVCKEINEQGAMGDASILQKVDNLCANLQDYVHRMLQKYHLYPDLLLPYLTGIEMVIFGLSSASNYMNIKEANPICKMKGINEFLHQFTDFASDRVKTPYHIAMSLLNPSVINNFKHIISLCDIPNPAKPRLLFKVIKSGLLEIINEIKVRSHPPKSVFSDLVDVVFQGLEYVWKEWKIRDEKLKEKKEEEESLYKYKTKHHEGELSDDEQFAIDLKEMFPVYEQDFNDLINVDESLDEKPQSLQKTNDESQNSIVQFSNEEMYEIWQLHAYVISLLSPSHLNEENDSFFNLQEPDFVTSYLLRHEVICSIVSVLGDRLDSFLEKSLLRGHMLLCHELSKLKDVNEEDYNIYQDPNPPKVVPLLNLLLKLVKRISDLLKEFPENVLLVQILVITRRIMSFPVSDPLMKFVVGLELLLKEVHEWEQNAHRGVSLKEEMEEISRKVIEIRALELDGWRKGLDGVIRKQYFNSSKWWFFMFTIFHPQNETDENANLRIVKMLQQCLEDSPLGEFSARLSILHTFYKHFLLHSSLPTQFKTLTDTLANIFAYYKQFLPAVENEILLIRAPIEKEMKDYVKIARWNDINFFSIKRSVEESHRHVLKRVKLFEKALKKPAKTVFVFPSKNVVNSTVNFPWSLEVKYQDFITKETEHKSDVLESSSVEIFKRVPTLQRRAKKLVKKVVENFPVIGHINVLNEFCGNVIETLQDASADGQQPVCTRSREKKQALAKIQTKKQMLAMLFKNLRNIGLSFGLGMIKTKEKEVDEILTVPSFDLLQMKILESDSSFKELLLKSSCDINHYFYKSLAQYAQLQKSMQLPSKDLTLDMVHRINGYGGHLMNIVTVQRSEIKKLAEKINSFGLFCQFLSSAYEEATSKNDFPTVLPPQNLAHNWEMETSGFMVQLITAVSQFSSFLDCTPSEKVFEKKFDTPCLDQKGFSNLLKTDAFWAEIKQETKLYIKSINQHFAKVSDTALTEPFAKWGKLSDLSSVFEGIRQSTEILVRKVLKQCNNDSYIASNLVQYCAKAKQRETCFNEEVRLEIENAANTQADKSQPGQVISNLCKKLVREILISFQDVTHFVTDSNKLDDVDDIPDKLLTEKIIGTLSDFKSLLRFVEVTKIVKKLKTYISRHEDSTLDLVSINDSLKILVHIFPLVNQYYQLLKVYFAVTLGMHRISCKFLSVLLEIFNLLSVKGFCIPQELQEEAAKGDTTQFEDIESGGLGDGEGEKDVSKDIKTEDQLEDALQEDQEKKENEEQKDMKDEEHGIEMTDDFEGKSFDKDAQKSDEEDNEQEEDVEELEKQMGDVDTEDAENLDDKVWGDDSEDEEIEEEDGTGGATEDMQSELVAKDDKYKEDIEKEKGDKDQKNQPTESLEDKDNDEYSGEKPDPMINAPPQPEPEIELPEDMEITDDVKGIEDDMKEVDDVEAMDVDDVEAMDEPKEGEEENQENNETEEGNKENVDEKAEDDQGNEDMQGTNLDDQDEVPPVDESEVPENENCLPTEKSTEDTQAMPAENEKKKSSSDPVQATEEVDWEGGGQNLDEQHQEGQAEAENSTSADAGHEGQKSTAKSVESMEQKKNSRLKPPGENRTLDDSDEQENVKRRRIHNEKSANKSDDPNADDNEMADLYEHVSNKEDSTSKAVDIAKEEETNSNNKVSNLEEDDDIIELSSSDEENENEVMKQVGDSVQSNQKQKAGEKGESSDKPVNTDIPNGEVVKTLMALRGPESTMHTQNELWKSLSQRNYHLEKLKNIEKIDVFTSDGKPCTSTELWRQFETQVSSLSQELCEQLRLVLEPTKMSKFKGDYRTGKRLNMRKIIPYIASQFHKDKIWMRRTKPSKRMYQIMLAVDDSFSMAFNNSKQLAFESFAVLGQSLTLLEAGELSVVSFGENVKLLHGFQEQFSASSGSKILDQLTFSQNKTKIAQLLNFATDAMIQARNSAQSLLVSKETAQLLIIISDGRGVFNEGEEAVKKAIRNARNNNIFMVFLILDDPSSKSSIFDIQCPVFEGTQVKGMMSYMDKFPFPFYIVLREISALPIVLGEALRQWFELVTSVER